MLRFRVHHPHLRRHGVALALPLLACAAFAPAAGAYDPTYYGQSPGPFCGNVQGGQSPIQLIKNKMIRDDGRAIAQMRLVYAPACGTAWVKVVSLATGYVFRPSVWRQNTSGPSTHEPAFNDAPIGVAWTAMIPARFDAVCGGVQAYHTLNRFVAAQGDHLSWNYLGCKKPTAAQRGRPFDPAPAAAQTGGGGSGSAPPATPAAETTGGVTHTWTNYTNAGGTEGPAIQARQTVQIACKVNGFRVADGNTAWYRIASSPWNGKYYVSADAFYNNGQTSGSLRGTPFFDPAVPNC